MVRSARRAIYTVFDYAGFPLRWLTRRFGLSPRPGSRWRYRFRRQFRYGDDTTYVKAIQFMDGVGLIEDWGCGTAYASQFVRQSAYRGIDESPGYADDVVDLRTYRSSVPCVLIRHVLEHNLEWASILDNAVRSFEKRLVVVIFTPFGDSTRILVTTPEGVPDIAFAVDDLRAHLPSETTIREERVSSRTKYGAEHIFYVSRE